METTRMRAALVSLLVLAAGCAKVSDNPLIGTWQSDADATLADMHRHPEVTEKSKRFFENDFFGHLRVTYTIDEYLTDDDKGFHTEVPYKVAQVTTDHVDVMHFDELQQKDVTERIHLDGNKIYVFTSKYNFKEYFRRIK
jgi:hypothetical protein